MTVADAAAGAHADIGRNGEAQPQPIRPVDVVESWLTSHVFGKVVYSRTVVPTSYGSCLLSGAGSAAEKTGSRPRTAFSYVLLARFT